MHLGLQIVIQTSSPPVFDGCLSEPDPVWDITWANTMRGQTDRQPCLGGEGNVHY